MNITTKKQIYIIAVMLTGVAFIAACSKQSETPVGKKGKKAPVVTNVKSIPLDDKNTISAVRNGQYVNLNWRLDTAGIKIKQIDIIRSPSGTAKTRQKVATLKPDASSYTDSLPDANACTYWVRLATDDGKFQEAGPARVDNDKAGAANYAKLEDKYKITITRTDDFATLQWDFPDDEYARIQIIRAPHPVTRPFSKLGNSSAAKKAKVSSIISSLERNAQYTDSLPNPNSEFWYWFQITLKSGAVIYKGPIKAEYASTNTKTISRKLPMPTTK